MIRSRTGIVAVVAATVALAGCAAMEDFATNPEKEKTRMGTGIGAAGGAVGNYQDKQEAALRRQMAGTGVDVVRRGDNITLDMPGNVTFGFDSANLNPQFNSVLDKVAETLIDYNQTVIQVAGHTDSTGSRDYNMKLSERRASSVKNYLVSRGVPAQRLVTIGAGPDHPVADNSTEAGRAENRRVELTIVPVTEDNLQKAKQG
jgi:outer membrane protein OmpA-like peptidoglycan-associated protein